MEDLALRDKRARHEVELEEFLVALDHGLPKFIVSERLKYLGRIVLT